MIAADRDFGYELIADDPVVFFHWIVNRLALRNIDIPVLLGYIDKSFLISLDGFAGISASYILVCV